jgi:hypothetical protein
VRDRCQHAVAGSHELLRLLQKLLELLPLLVDWAHVLVERQNPFPAQGRAQDNTHNPDRNPLSGAGAADALRANQLPMQCTLGELQSLRAELLRNDELPEWAPKCFGFGVLEEPGEGRVDCQDPVGGIHNGSCHREMLKEQGEEGLIVAPFPQQWEKRCSEGGDIHCGAAHRQHR